MRWKNVKKIITKKNPQKILLLFVIDYRTNHMFSLHYQCIFLKDFMHTPQNNDICNLKQFRTIFFDKITEHGTGKVQFYHSDLKIINHYRKIWRFLAFWELKTVQKTTFSKVKYVSDYMKKCWSVFAVY